MTDVIAAARQKAAQRPRRIVLPETDDTRTIEAIRHILDARIAKVIAIGPEEARKKIGSPDSDAFTLLSPASYGAGTDGLIDLYHSLRKHKGMTADEARTIVTTEPVVFGALLVRSGVADGFVAGASHTTRDVARTAIHCLEIDPVAGGISSAFLMAVPGCAYGESGIFVFADCGINPDPSPDRLAGIGAAAGRLFEQLVGKKAVIAFLSYSSKGSAKGPIVQKVADAVAKARALAPATAIDGELQADSAIDPEVARLKCAASPVAGKANVLIFPDLNSGNISYKLVQRLGRARAVGPLIMGTTRPCSDLSRGCTADDIIDAVAATSLRAG